MFPGMARYDLQRIGIAMALFGAACMAIASIAVADGLDRPAIRVARRSRECRGRPQTAVWRR
jgi:hypothetical protein